MDEAKTDAEAGSSGADRSASEQAIELSFERFGEFLEAFSENISVAGMFLPSEELRPIGATIEFTFRLIDGYKLLSGVGEVLWTRDSWGDKKTPGMGILFCAMDSNSQDLVTKVVETHSREGGDAFDIYNPPEAAPTAVVAADLDAAGDAVFGESTVEPFEDPSVGEPAAGAALGAASFAPVAESPNAESIAGFSLESSSAVDDVDESAELGSGFLDSTDTPSAASPSESVGLEAHNVESPQVESSSLETPVDLEISADASLDEEIDLGSPSADVGAQLESGFISAEELPDIEVLPASDADGVDLMTGIEPAEDSASELLTGSLLAGPSGADSNVAEDLLTETSDIPLDIEPPAPLLSGADGGSEDVLGLPPIELTPPAADVTSLPPFEGAKDAVAEGELLELEIDDVEGAADLSDGMLDLDLPDDDPGEAVSDSPLAGLPDIAALAADTVDADTATTPTEAVAAAVTTGEVDSTIAELIGDSSPVPAPSVAPVELPDEQVTAEGSFGGYAGAAHSASSAGGSGSRTLLVVLVGLLAVAGLAYWGKDSLLERFAGPSESPKTARTSGPGTAEGDGAKDRAASRETPDTESSAASTDTESTPEQAGSANGETASTEDAVGGLALEPTAAVSATAGESETPATDAVEGGDTSAAANGAAVLANAPTKVTNIEWRQSGTGTTVTVVSNGGFSDGTYDVVRLTSGSPRELIRLLGVEEPYEPARVGVGSDQVVALRTGLHREKDGRPALHLVVDLASSDVAVTSVETSGSRLVLRVE